MSVFIYGFLLVGVAFCIHIIVWKIRIPQNHAQALLFIFLSTLVIGFIILFRFPHLFKFLPVSPPTLAWEYLQILFFHISIMAAYIATYPAIEIDSPSLVMILDVVKAGPNGLEKRAFNKSADNDILIAPRIRDLVDGKMIYLDGQKYKIAQTGVAIARLFITYRKLLKEKEKGG